MMFKEEVFACCAQLIEERISGVRSTLNDLRESAANETKSTAGDKHETALAMLQIEQKNVSAQLENLNLLLLNLKPLKDVKGSIRVVNGSLVETDKGHFYVSIALGKIPVGNSTVIALSAQSPLGRVLLGTVADQTISFNKIDYRIIAIS